jgi:hypothetical protein
MFNKPLAFNLFGALLFLGLDLDQIMSPSFLVTISYMA